jgi:hypothetical protein
MKILPDGENFRIFLPVAPPFVHWFLLDRESLAGEEGRGRTHM